MKSGKEIIEKIYWEELEKEGITKEDLSLVMLDIAFSPVIPIEGGNPCDVKKTIGGKYLVDHFSCPTAVSEEDLKIMRYRYLINR